MRGDSIRPMDSSASIQDFQAKIRIMISASRNCLFLLLGLGLLGPAEAMRCGNRIVTEGDLAGHVLAVCGEPVVSRSWTEVRVQPVPYTLWYHPANRQHHTGLAVLPVEVLVEEWTYNLGARRFMRVLRFENGELVRIRTTRYGFSPQ